MATSDARSVVERRVVLTGALASLALGTSACSVEVDQVADAPDVAPTIPPGAEAPAVTVGPQLGGFGGRVAISKLDTFQADVERSGGFLYAPSARAWLVTYPVEFLERALGKYPEELHEGLEAGVLALYQKCPHLGCRVPECTTSQEFGCPCHGSMYTHYGEHIAGPAPRGMDLFPVRILDGVIHLETSTIIEGLPQGTDVTGWEAAGPGCITS